VIELSQGFEGHIATVEALFYALDTLPLFLAIAVYVPFWPGRFIAPIPRINRSEEEGSSDNVGEKDSREAVE
jgi:hypothetical protein